MNRRGKIYSVACQDFVSYDSTIFFPGEFLNIIIGPNGTGKSTLVAAIVICMGGKPELLSRSSNLMDYIKHGCEEAQVEVHVFDDEVNTISFKRVFNSEGSDEFFIKNKKFNRKQFLTKVKEYNIQVGNLCQFLPQDRVQDFAKMNAQEMLYNTQISVCSQEVQEQFEKLVETRQKQKTVGKDTTTRQKELTDLEAKNDALRPQIENMRARTALVEDLEMCKRKQAWMEYNALDAKVTEYKNDQKKAQEKLNEAKKKLEPVQREARHILEQKQAMENKIGNDTTEISTKKNDISKHNDKLDKLKQEIIRAKGDRRHAIQNAREQKEEVKQAKTALTALKTDLQHATAQQANPEAFKNDMARLRQRFQESSERRNKLINQRDQIQAQHRDNLKHNIESTKNRIANMENIEKRKLELLASKHEEVYRAFCWLRDNRHQFRGHIYNPMILELNVKDPKNAKYLENAIQNRDLIAFTCENKADMGVFLNKMRVEMKLNVNVIHSDSADRLMYGPTLSIDQMRRYGFSQYLIDMIDGPPAILNYLCKIYRIHDVPLGSETTAQNASKVPDHIRVFFTPTMRFNVTVSRYSGAKSILSSEIMGHNMLNIGVDQHALQQHKQHLQELINRSDKMRNDVSQIETQLRTVEDTISQINADKKGVESQMNALKNAADKVKRQEYKLAQLEKTVIDVAAEKAKYVQRVKNVISEYIVIQREIGRIILEFSKYVFSVETQRKKLGIFLQTNQEIDLKIRQLEEEVRSAKRLYDTIDRHIASANHARTVKEKEAKRLTDGRAPSDRNFPFKRQFAELPQEEEALTQHLTDVQARIDCMRANDQSIIDEYERRAEQIEGIKADIRNTLSQSGNLQKHIDQLHSKWYPEILKIVQVINVNFARFLASMGLAGEVELTRNGEFDYQEYGITIRVKYRAQEKMQALDRYVQSGGERAVATAVYTLSIQHISNVPFRCVDEINQGMDPGNERKIFEMLVDETCQPGNSQYFFVTPKLLPNLKYNDLMTVLIVHNGPHITDPYVFVRDQIQC